MKIKFNAITAACFIAIAVIATAAPVASATEGTITRITTVNGDLRFWIKECGDEKFFYVGRGDLSHEQAKLIVMAARFSGRPIAVPNDCPASGNESVTQIDLIQY